jgi:glycosyltransferase involved in cell wall biosynthesis
MIKILFLIRALEIGGAERQLVELVRHLDRTRFEVLVVTFYDGGALRPQLENLPGVRVTSLGKIGRWDFLNFLGKLLHLIRTENPDILHGYLDIPNFFSLVCGKLARKKVIFGVRGSSIEFSNYDWTMGATYRLANLASILADKIILNSFYGLEFHAHQGMSAKRAIVIPNGIDTTRYQPDRALGLPLRHAWNLTPDEILIGLVGRIDPQKGYETFLQAAQIVKQAIPAARFICLGEGPQAYWQSLKAQAEALQLDILWPGNRQDMPAVYNALDLFVSASYGEGFPNVIGEALACGLPCVVTDAGDSRLILGEAGEVVPVKNPQALADAILSLVDQSATHQRHELGQKARKRLVANFSIEKMVAATESVFNELAAKPE